MGLVRASSRSIRSRGMPEDFDAAVVFLLPTGARFRTGQAIVIDGGWSCTDGQLGGPAPSSPLRFDRTGTP